jgi:hypothetical protein
MNTLAILTQNPVSTPEMKTEMKSLETSQAYGSLDHINNSETRGRHRARYAVRVVSQTEHS